MTDIFAPDFDPNRDMPRKRPLEIDESNDFIITQTDPYGFWYISRERGQIPDSLSGAYSSPQMARKAVESYILTKPKEEKIEKPERPVVKEKKK